MLWLFALSYSNELLLFAGLSFTEAERRLKENGPNVPVDFSFPRWWNFLWHAFFHPFNIILIILSVISYITSDSPNGCIMLVLVLISVCLRFYQVFLAYFLYSNRLHIYIYFLSSIWRGLILNSPFRNTEVQKQPWNFQNL